MANNSTSDVSVVYYIDKTLTFNPTRKFKINLKQC